MHVLIAKNINIHTEKIHTEAPSLVGFDTVSLGIVPHTLRPMVISSSSSSTLSFCWAA
jgi:hypothetical protein